MLCFLVACSREKEIPFQQPVTPNTPPVDTTNPADKKNYLALGDSYTIGTSVGADERFPVQTVARLITTGVPMNPAEIRATNGWTTGNLLFSLNSTLPSKTNYDLVSLLIGVNNQYQGRSQAEYRIEFMQLLNKAIAYASGRKSRVFVLSIPDYSVTPFGQNYDTARIRSEIDAFNAINKEISLQSGVTYVDITGISREARYLHDLVASDGLHPSGRQYQRWVNLLAPVMKAAL